MLFELLKRKQIHPLSYNIRSLSTDEAAFEVLPANRYYHSIVTHKSTVARTVMCRQDGRGRFPVLLDDHSKCREIPTYLEFFIWYVH